MSRRSRQARTSPARATSALQDGWWRWLAALGVPSSGASSVCPTSALQDGWWRWLAALGVLSPGASSVRPTSAVQDGWWGPAAPAVPSGPLFTSKPPAKEPKP